MRVRRLRQVRLAVDLAVRASRTAESGHDTTGFSDGWFCPPERSRAELHRIARPTAKKVV